ncbi:DUF6049 family protein [Bifidobacterium parmae]|uniref:DUF6049 family protein n=1 Tax=Bifidobacterium parmae TaxID=361854 RepID=UPI001FAEB5D1|nr:DUF6049 family protein [Bifidobacterium parmae]
MIQYAPLRRIQAWWRIAAGMLLAAAFVAGAVALPASASAADGDAANAGTARSASGAANADGTTDTSAQTLALTEMTAVVTDTSGFHLKATVTNTGDAAWAAGEVTLDTNPMFTFTSRTDMQEWAQSESPIPAPASLGSASVPALQPKQSATVTIDQGADAQALTQMLNWGPKPLLVTYTHDGANVAVHTFLTRSSAGLDNANTPAMTITMAMPLTSGHWTADADTLTKLVTDDTDDSAGSSNGSNNGSTGTGSTGKATAIGAAVLEGDHTRFDHSLEQTISKHSSLQTIADPTYLDALAMPPQTTAIMQPAGFDITAYTAQENAAERYANAGIGDDAWNASAALADYRAALGDQKATSRTIAWQGQGQWTLDALTAARRQGYTTVVSTHDFESSETDTVHTGTVVVPTDAGDVTVLVEQRELSNLAKGKATNAKATAESTMAGRLARFVAQSAFYQMEQPYNERDLLVCFSADSDAATVDAFMDAVESASWLKTGDLDALAHADPYASGDDARNAVPADSGMSAADSSNVTNVLASLSAGRGDITRFRDSILGDGDDNDNGNGSNNGDDGKAASAWIGRLLDAHAELALHALAIDGGSAEVDTTTSMTAVGGAQQLANDLLGGVSLTPSETVTMVSETATMPVTVSNSTPYPVTIRVFSITDSPEIVTSRRNTVTIPARGEAQVTFTLRAATSGSATAHVSLQDRGGVTFGGSQDTAINCVLKISDKTGFIIIGLAVALGALGLWRQFNRKKDPDE